MIILGIDPGIAIVGYGVVQFEKGSFKTLAMGSVETPSGLDTESRIEIIYNDITELIDLYRPTELAIEELFFNTNQKTVIAVAEARGVILLAAKKKNLCISEYTPLQVKQSVVGYGKAGKKQVTELVRIILSLENVPKLDDTSDALAIAICHAHCAGSRIQEFYNQKKKKLL